MAFYFIQVTTCVCFLFFPLPFELLLFSLFSLFFFVFPFRFSFVSWVRPRDCIKGSLTTTWFGVFLPFDICIWTILDLWKDSQW